MYAPLEVDVTGWLQDRLSEHLTARVLTELPRDLETVAKDVGVVQVVRAGGFDDGFIVDQARMVTHAFADTPQNARALSYLIGTAYRAIVGQAADGAVLQSVRTVSGPTPNNYPNTSVREVVRTDELRIKTTG